MHNRKLTDLLSAMPVIAAVKDEDGLAECLRCDAKVVFVLFGTVVDIADITHRIKAAGKVVIVHIDLIDGLAAREVAVDYIAGATEADGIISTRPQLVKRANEKNLISVRRFFLLDSMAQHNIERNMAPGSADLIEVLPGVAPKALRAIVSVSPIPVIAGGLISDKEDVYSALSAGALAVSSTNAAVWYL